jgi:hypothetical protein
MLASRLNPLARLRAVTIMIDPIKHLEQQAAEIAISEWQLSQSAMVSMMRGAAVLRFSGRFYQILRSV